MEVLSNQSLKLFLDDELYLIDESASDNTSINIDSKELNEPQAKYTKVNFKGNNDKGIGIIISESAHEYLDPTDEVLLKNILTAIGLTLQDVAIINQHHSNSTWQKDVDFLKVIAFGVEAGDYNITTEKYAISAIQNTSWLFSHSLADLAANKELKGKLWVKLKELFNQA